MTQLEKPSGKRKDDITTNICLIPYLVLGDSLGEGEEYHGEEYFPLTGNPVFNKEQVSRILLALFNDKVKKYILGAPNAEDRRNININMRGSEGRPNLNYLNRVAREELERIKIMSPEDLENELSLIENKLSDEEKKKLEDVRTALLNGSESVEESNLDKLALSIKKLSNLNEEGLPPDDVLDGLAESVADELAACSYFKDAEEFKSFCDDENEYKKEMREALKNYLKNRKGLIKNRKYQKDEQIAKIETMFFSKEIDKKKKNAKERKLLKGKLQTQQRKSE